MYLLQFHSQHHSSCGSVCSGARTCDTKRGEVEMWMQGLARFWGTDGTSGTNLLKFNAWHKDEKRPIQQALMMTRQVCSLVSVPLMYVCMPVLLCGDEHVCLQCTVL